MEDTLIANIKQQYNNFSNITGYAVKGSMG